MVRSAEEISRELEELNIRIKYNWQRISAKKQHKRNELLAIRASYLTRRVELLNELTHANNPQPGGREDTGI